MRHALAVSILAASALAGPDALPCGGGFGDELVIQPDQQIVVSHRAGIETYLFNPYFCGEATEFGLILPVPGSLTEDPALADPQLLSDLDTLTEPIVVEKFYCPEGDSAGGDDDDGMLGGGRPNQQSGVDVVDTGQVGIFDWVLLQATATDAFTTWLDTNGFPYDPAATPHFGHYVDQGWYFVAFRVTAAAEAPPSGMKVCGSLGPLRLSFATADPVIPARIVAATSDQYDLYVWQVYAFADVQLQAEGYDVWDTLLYSGPVTAGTLQTFPRLAELATAGQRLTKLNAQFYGAELSGDIALTPSPNQADFRHVQTKYVYDCGCGLSRTLGMASGRTLLPALGLMGLMLWMVRRRRRRR
ncbi:MAG: DUF2330 domain-containing protein [Deltaproteobacteria bacterium]|jgi:hypothetical protein|nr:DUF2330 domain-containing protein [Deltaproteobacteria bacterium]MBW2532606.1 DUF2330 domain-containing protein [Deltaproteobacteria bacterium]